MNKKKPLYKIGELFTEFVDGINLSSGIITKVKYDPLDNEYVYSILWNDMAIETELFESIIKWRIENEIFCHYKILK
jgi:hypothetical protein